MFTVQCTVYSMYCTPFNQPLDQFSNHVKQSYLNHGLKGQKDRNFLREI